MAEEIKSLELRAAERLERFVEREFNPAKPVSWKTLETLWRGALLARDVRRLDLLAQRAAA